MRIVPTALYFDIILTDPLCRRSHCLSRRGREQRVLPMPLLLLWKDGRTGAACHPRPIFLWTECRSPPHTPIVEESSASLEGAEENPPRASSPRFPFLILKNKGVLVSFRIPALGFLPNPSLERMLESSLPSLCPKEVQENLLKGMAYS